MTAFAVVVHVFAMVMFVTIHRRTGRLLASCGQEYKGANVGQAAQRLARRHTHRRRIELIWMSCVFFPLFAYVFFLGPVSVYRWESVPHNTWWDLIRPPLATGSATVISILGLGGHYALSRIGEFDPRSTAG